MAQSLPQVDLKSSWATKDLLRLDVYLNNIPSNLFGSSFHLESSSSDWELDHYEVGEVFAAGDPLVAIKYQNNGLAKIVTGLSLKRGSILETQAGRLVTFYLKADQKHPPMFKFTHNILSTFMDGRKDIDQVNWADSTSTTSTLSAQKSLTPPKKSNTSNTDVSSKNSPFLLSSQMLNDTFSHRIKHAIPSGRELNPFEASSVIFLVIFIFVGVIVWRLQKKLSSVSLQSSSPPPPSTLLLPSTSLHDSVSSSLNATEKTPSSKSSAPPPLPTSNSSKESDLQSHPLSNNID